MKSALNNPKISDDFGIRFVSLHSKSIKFKREANFQIISGSLLLFCCLGIIFLSLKNFFGIIDFMDFVVFEVAE